MNRVLIVNADDFGQSDAITDGILQAAHAGTVTSTTLLATAGPSAERALRLATDLPCLGVGLHLNLTEGRPVAEPVELPNLVDSAGQFCHAPLSLLFRAMTSRRFREQVRLEWTAQIRWMLDRGHRPTHLDSHKHVHMAPPLFAIACELARQFGVACVRLANEPMWRGPWSQTHAPLSRARRLRQTLAGQALRWSMATVNRRIRRRAGLGGNDYLFGLADTGGIGLSAIDALLRSLPAGVSELMVHPGLPDAAGAGRLASSRPIELASLIAAAACFRSGQRHTVLAHYGGSSERQTPLLHAGLDSRVTDVHPRPFNWSDPCEPA